MQGKGEMSDLQKSFVTMVKTQFERNVKIVRSDNGFDFTSVPVQKFYRGNVVLRQRNYVDTP